MESVELYIGIDIAKSSFVAARWDADKKRYFTHQYAYLTDADIQSFADTLTGRSVHLIMEATGIYHLRLAYALCDAGIPVSVVNPASVKHFAKMKNRITKTDRQDAVLLARYGCSEKPSLFVVPSETLNKLSQRRMILRQIKEQKQALCNQREAVSCNPKPDTFTSDYLNKTIARLEEDINDIQVQIKELVDSDYKDHYENLISIPGFGDATATAFIEAAESFAGLDGDNAVKAFSKFVGLAPTCHQSGATVRGQSHISRTAAPDLRRKLYMPAMSICTKKKAKESVFKTFYQRLREIGKSHKKAIIAVMHKMVRVAVAVIRSGVKFDPKVYGQLQTK